MYSDMSRRTIAASSSNRNSASALASSVLPTPVGPRKMNDPIGRPGSPQARARALDRQAHPLDGVVLADDPAAQPILDAEQLLPLALEHARDRDAGPVGDHARDVHRLDGVFEQPLAGLRLAQLRLGGAARACSSAGMRP